ncbi:hypothetical protein C8R44DRAFT_849356 [Mycena epipterygia]|nr:hypothetical protein C8R44DRAFT_849356 [Mycena epipterygia]
MTSQPTVIQIRLDNITTCLTLATATLRELSEVFGTSFTQVISRILQTLVTAAQLTYCQTIKRNKAECTKLLENIYKVIQLIIELHMKAEPRGELPLSTLHHIAQFTETLHKICAFVEAQQDGNKLRYLFRQSEINQLLKDCTMGMQQAFDVFQVDSKVIVLNDIKQMQEIVKKQHEELLELIATLSDGTISDKASSMKESFTTSYNSSNSLSLLPSQPTIFHGRDEELQEMVDILKGESPRIAILGAGGIGKTSLARAALHHPDIVLKYECRFFAGAESVTNSIELAALVGAHLGLKHGKNLTKQVIRHLSKGPKCLLILDNLESAWESMMTRAKVEELLALLADISHLALVITMRGAERPAKVRWTRPFLAPLDPLTHAAARQTFIDIADDFHKNEDIEKLLLLTDNMPLAVNLVAHLVDYEGCLNILARWEVEKTSMLSQGYDRRSSLDGSIELSLSSPRVSTAAKNFLSLLSILPDGISDFDICQINLPIKDILACKTTLLRTSLAYSNNKGQLKALAPIREYMQKSYPPEPSFVQPLSKHFQQLLDFGHQSRGHLAGASAVDHISSNLANLQNMLSLDMYQDNPRLPATIESALSLNRLRLMIGLSCTSLMDYIPVMLQQLDDHRLAVLHIAEVFQSWWEHPISDPDDLVEKAREHLQYIDDPVTESKFSINAGEYYLYVKNNVSRATKLFETALSLSTSCGDITQQANALGHLSFIKWMVGDYSTAQTQARETQKLAKLCANLYKEASALRIEAISCHVLGDFKHSMLSILRARELLALSGMTGGDMDHTLLVSKAQIHLLKSEYTEAHEIHNQMARETSAEQDPVHHGFALLNMAEIDVMIGTPADGIQQNLDKTKAIFSNMQFSMGVMACEITLADLYLREGDTLGAKSLYQKYFNLSWGKYNDGVKQILDRLGDPSRWSPADLNWTSAWTIVFLGYGLKLKDKLAIHQALRCFGDIFVAMGDDCTAVSLFTVALEGFTWMDVHRSRADCMLRLGDISYKQGHLSKAVEYWTSAQPLFARSLQTTIVSSVDVKLASVDEKISKQHGQLV